MSIYNHLTDTDIKNIMSYISAYSGENCSDLEHTLRYWSQEKEAWFHRFGDKFIISQPIEITENADIIMRKFEEKNFYEYNSPYQQFCRALKEKQRPFWNEYYSTRYSELTDAQRATRKIYEVIDNLLDGYCLASNKWNLEEKTITINGVTIKIYKNSSVIRTLGKIAKLFNLEAQFEKFRNYHSTFLQTKKIKATLNLSIHPLDFMTASDNNHNWGSCMSWREGGCYRSGTVEMMNSPMVLCAYLTDDNTKMQLPSGNDWNSKMWRAFVIADPSVGLVIKGYPYCHEEIAKCALNLINSVTNWYEGEVFCHVKDRTIYKGSKSVCFETNAMYNDVGLGAGYGIWGKDEVELPGYINYSGMNVCMGCGEERKYVDEGQEGDLVCNGCGGYNYCACCGGRINEWDSYWFEDEQYCEYCYNDHVFVDDITEENVWDDDSVTIEIYKEDRHYSSLCVRDRVWRDEPKIWSEYIAIEEPREKSSDRFWYRPTLYINVEDLTDKGYKQFIY